MQLKNWLQHGKQYDTTQATLRDGKLVRVWSPGVRTVDTSKATYAQFDGSRRDYRGVHHVLHNETDYVAYDVDMQTYIVYKLAH